MFREDKNRPLSIKRGVIVEKFKNENYMRINMGMISMEFLEQNMDRYHRYQLVKSMDENSSRMTISNKLHPYILYLSFYRLICIKWTQQSDTYL